MMNSNERLDLSDYLQSTAGETFEHELSLIHDKTTRDFVITCFDKLCPDYFWTCPYSTSGKYHPQVSLGVGGLVRHTKLAVWWGIELLHALGTSPELYSIPDHILQDEVIATLLLHDMIKNGKGLNAQGRPFESGVTGTHGTVLANKISEGFFQRVFRADTAMRILDGIACHMGIWTTNVEDRPDNLSEKRNKAFANLIHLADYCASRKVDSIYSDLEQEKTNDITKNPTTTQITEKSKNGISQSPPYPGARPTEGC